MIIKKVLKFIFFALCIIGITFFFGYKIAHIANSKKTVKKAVKPATKQRSYQKKTEVPSFGRENLVEDIQSQIDEPVYTPVNPQPFATITSAPGEADEQFYDKMVSTARFSQSKAVFNGLMKAYDKKFQELYNMIDQMTRMNHALQIRTAQGESFSSIEKSLVEEARYRNSLEAQIQAQQQLIATYNSALTEAKGYINYLESRKSK